MDSAANVIPFQLPEPKVQGFLHVGGKSADRDRDSLYGTEAANILKANPSGTILARDADGRLVPWLGDGEPAGMLQWNDPGHRDLDPAMIGFSHFQLFRLHHVRIPPGVSPDRVWEALGPAGLGLLIG